MRAPIREHLLAGHVIPAHPLALTSELKLDERRQRALTRYYIDAGAGGLAVGVHTTQFEIREHGLYRPVLELAAESAARWLERNPRDLVKVAGICGLTEQALTEAQTATELGYHAGLLSLGAFKSDPESDVLVHCRRVAEAIPLFGFYLQPAVGGRKLSYRFWREFAEIQNVVAIKIAAFNRYQTLDVVRAVADSGRGDIALYTGNDDNIYLDLVTPLRFSDEPRSTVMRFAGGLLGQWAVWTHTAVMWLRNIYVHRRAEPTLPADRGLQPHWLTTGLQLTDANGAIFDAANNFAGCVPGIHEILRRQGLLAGTWCLNPHEHLSPGQSEEIDRILAAYPDLTDDAFVQEHLDLWLNS
jgi:dihydrodipicolinate synthase/N-acetylneuraminate lyase